MVLYRKVVYVLTPERDSTLKEYNAYWRVLYTISNEAEIAEYEKCSDYRYIVGGYMSPSKGNYAFGFEPYSKDGVIL